jgi:hypothetical protein
LQQGFLELPVIRINYYKTASVVGTECMLQELTSTQSDCQCKLKPGYIPFLQHVYGCETWYLPLKEDGV